MCYLERETPTKYGCAKTMGISRTTAIKWFDAMKWSKERDAEYWKVREWVIIYGEAFQKDPDFYEFIRTLETYEKTIDGNTTLILPSTAEILKYLSGNSTQN